jgi:type IV pilus assembly protein PilV
MRRPHTSSARGFSLIEPLVALVVLSIGLIGTAGMLFTSLRGNAEALRRAAAVNLAADLAERIRMNPLARDAWSATGGLEPDCNASACSAADRAAHDLATWQSAVHRALPSNDDTQSEIRFTRGNTALPDHYRIVLRWRETYETQAEQVVLAVLMFTGDDA